METLATQPIPGLKFRPIPGLKVRRKPWQKLPGSPRTPKDHRAIPAAPNPNPDCCNEQILDDINSLTALLPDFEIPELNQKNCINFVNDGVMVPFVNELTIYLDSQAIDGLGGGGKINQKGGFVSKGDVYEVVKSLFRFIKRACACSLLAGTIKAATDLIFILLTKVGVSAATVVPTTVNATATSAVAAPSIISLIPTAVIAGCGVAIAIDLYKLLNTVGARRPMKDEEATEWEGKIDKAREIAAAEDFDAASRELQANRELEDNLIKLRGTGMLAVTQVRLGQTEAAAALARDAVQNAAKLALDRSWILRMVVNGIIELDKLVDFVADLPEDMITLAKGIAIEPNEDSQLEKFYELKGKVIISTLLLGAGLPSPFLQVLSVLGASGKIGSELYKNVYTLYNAGLGEAGTTAFEQIALTVIRVFNKIMNVSERAGLLADETRAGRFKLAKTAIDSLKGNAGEFGDLMEKAAGPRSTAAQAVQAVQAAKQEKAVEDGSSSQTQQALLKQKEAAAAEAKAEAEADEELRQTIEGLLQKVKEAVEAEKAVDVASAVDVAEAAEQQAVEQQARAKRQRTGGGRPRRRRTKRRSKSKRRTKSRRRRTLRKTSKRTRKTNVRRKFTRKSTKKLSRRRSRKLSRK